jgi:hypothetical protein
MIKSRALSEKFSQSIYLTQNDLDRITLPGSLSLAELMGQLQWAHGRINALPVDRELMDRPFKFAGSAVSGFRIQRSLNLPSVILRYSIWISDRRWWRAREWLAERRTTTERRSTANLCSVANAANSQRCLAKKYCARKVA